MFLIFFAGLFAAQELFAAAPDGATGPSFPPPLHAYADQDLPSVLAIIHTFLATKFMHLVAPLSLALGTLIPTAIMAVCFLFL